MTGAGVFTQVRDLFATLPDPTTNWCVLNWEEYAALGGTEDGWNRLAACALDENDRDDTLHLLCTHHEEKP
jgi:hypothetical protein